MNNNGLPGYINIQHVPVYAKIIAFKKIYKAANDASGENILKYSNKLYKKALLRIPLMAFIRRDAPTR